jgi:cobyrinic acid a,c-diamide synthase
MVGIVPANTVMHQRPQGRGYIHLKSTAEHNWQLNVGKEIFAHEFHYSRLEQLSSGQKFAFEVLRGDGIDGKYDGIVYKNLLAGYAHLRDVAGYNWTRYFLDHVRNIHRNNQCNNQ